MIHALVFAAALAGNRAAKPLLRARPLEAPQAAPGGAKLGSQTEQAISAADSPPDPELHRIESILQRMQQDPALRQKLYEDVDSVVRAVRNRQPIPESLRVGYGLPVTEHQAQPGLVATLRPATVASPPFSGSSLNLQLTLPSSDAQPAPAVLDKLLSPAGTLLDPAVVKRLVHWAQANECPIQLALATAWRESEMSLYPPRGSSGEIGIMQIMPERARLEGVDPARLEDPETNMWLGTKLLARYYKQEGSVVRAAMMYVAGPGVFEKTYGPDLRNYIAHYSSSVDNFATYFGTYLSF